MKGKEKLKNKKPEEPKEPTFPITAVEHTVMGGDHWLVIKFDLIDGDQQIFYLHFVFVKQKVMSLLQRFKGEDFYKILMGFGVNIESEQNLLNETQKRKYLITHNLEKLVAQLFEIRKRNKPHFSLEDVMIEEYILVPKIRDLGALLI